MRSGDLFLQQHTTALLRGACATFFLRDVGRIGPGLSNPPSLPVPSTAVNKSVFFYLFFFFYVSWAAHLCIVSQPVLGHCRGQVAPGRRRRETTASHFVSRSFLTCQLLHSMWPSTINASLKLDQCRTLPDDNMSCSLVRLLPCEIPSIAMDNPRSTIVMQPPFRLYFSKLR